jgi:hypothetical protein
MQGAPVPSRRPGKPGRVPGRGHKPSGRSRAVPIFSEGGRAADRYLRRSRRCRGRRGNKLPPGDDHRIPFARDQAVPRYAPSPDRVSRRARSTARPWSSRGHREHDRLGPPRLRPASATAFQSSPDFLSKSGFTSTIKQPRGFWQRQGQPLKGLCVDDAIEQVTGVSRRILLDRLRPLQPAPAVPRGETTSPTPKPAEASPPAPQRPVPPPQPRPFCPPPHTLVEILRGETIARAIGPREVKRLLRTEALKGLL